MLLATHDHLEDSQKVILFLHNLGTDGFAIASKLFPKLVNYNVTPDPSVTFAQVWWQFNEHCWTRSRPKPDPSKDLAEDRMRLLEICDEEGENVSLIFLL